MTSCKFASKVNVAGNQSTASDYSTCNYKTAYLLVTLLQLLVPGIADKRRRGMAKESQSIVKRTSELVCTYRITEIAFGWEKSIYNLNCSLKESKDSFKLLWISDPYFLSLNYKKMWQNNICTSKHTHRWPRRILKLSTPGVKEDFHQEYLRFFSNISYLK
jgi:hypothetical protein